MNFFAIFLGYVVQMYYLCTTNFKYQILNNMATVLAFVRVKKGIDRAFVRFRLRDGRNFQLYHVSNIEVNPSNWDKKRQEIKAKVVIS